MKTNMYLLTAMAAGVKWLLALKDILYAIIFVVFKFTERSEKKRTEFLCRVCVISTQNWFISLDAWVLNWVVMLFWKCAKVQRLFSQHNVTNIFQLEHLLKASKYRKQNTKFSHPPKNQQNFVHFLPQPLKVVESKNLKLFIVLNSP